MLNKEIFIHIGMGKSASSFLQEFIFPNLKHTLFVNNKYDLDNAYHPDELSKFISQLKSINPLMIDFDAVEKTIDTLSNTVVQPKCLISEEALFGNPFYNFNDSDAIARVLKCVFKQPKIIIVIRKQDDYLESWYKQLLHQGMSLSINTFLNYKNGRFLSYDDTYVNFPENLVNTDVYQYDYYKLIRNHYEVFGEENVLVLPYEMFRENKSEFMNRLLGFLGEEITENMMEKQKVSNRSYSLITGYLARFLNRFLLKPYNQCGFIPQNPFAAFFVKHRQKNIFYRLMANITVRLNLRWFLSQLDKLFYVKYDFMNEHQKKEILRIHHESNRNLSKLLDIDLQKYGY